AQGADHRISADPSLPLQVRYQGLSAGRALHAQAALNGGGEVLHLTTGSGDIQLKYLDARTERQLNAQQRALTAQELNQQRALLTEMEHQAAAVFAVPAQEASTTATAQSAPSPEASPDPPSGFEIFARRIEGFWWGGVRVDPDEQQKRLRHAVRPAYPEAA